MQLHHQRRSTTGLALAPYLVAAAASLALDRASVTLIDNQHTYFLHGLANAGLAELHKDFIAQSPDPTPLFSLLVEAVSVLPPWVFVVLHMVTVSILSVSLVAIGKSLFCLTMQAGLMLGALVGLLQLPMSNPWEGFASQYLVNGYLQPSSFGVLIVAAVAIFLRGRHPIAVVVAVPAAWLHPTYALSVATFAFAVAMTLWWADRRWQGPALAVCVALIGLAPVVLYVKQTFVGSPNVMRRSDEILATVRIPHHALPGDWSLFFTSASVGLLALAIIIVRDWALRILIGAPSILALAGALAVVLTQHYGIALLFPWRVSVWTLPIAAVAVMAACIARLERSALRSSTKTFATVVVLALTAASTIGNLVQDLANGQEHQPAYKEAALYIRSSTPESATVLIDPYIGPDMRVLTERPIFVDWKTHPYLADDVLAWFQRLRKAEAVVELRTRHPCLADEAARLLGVQLVIAPENSPACATTTIIYSDADYRVYEI